LVILKDMHSFTEREKVRERVCVRERIKANENERE